MKLSDNTPSAVCTSCGAGLNQGDMFCVNCGQNLAPSALPVAPTFPAVPNAQLQLTCTRCGTALEPDDNFCINCGQKITGEIPSPSPYAVTSAPAASQQTYSMSNQARMPLMFLLDTSASASPFISQLTSGLNRFKSEVSQNAQAVSILDVSIIEFHDSPYVLQPYFPVAEMKPVRLIAGGPSIYSAAIQKALSMAEDYTRTKVNFYKPWIIMITNGGPADDISAVAGVVQSLQQADKLRFMALGTQDYDAVSLKRLTDVVFRQDGDDYTSFFNWISKCMWAIAKTSPGEKPQLPTLEGNVYRDK